MSALDPPAFRHAVGHFATGVTVMTTCLKDRLHGMTVSAFCSLSLNPLMVLVCVEKTTVMHRLAMESRVFAINILSAAEEGLSRFYADNSRLDRPEFVPGTFTLGQNGCPLLNSATAILEARVSATYDGGDHTIMVGAVTATDVRSTEPPLIFYRGGYTTLKA